MKRWLPLLLAVTTPIAAQTSQPQSSNDGPALTIYNQDFAVIRDHIPLELKAGTNSIHFSGVTAQLEPGSVMLRDCSGKRTPRILEQNFRPPVSQQQMLTLFEGQTIDFQVAHGSEYQIIQGKIIRAGNPCVPNLPCRSGTGYYPGPSYSQAESPNNEQPLVEVNGKLQFSLPGTPMFPTASDQSGLHPQINWQLETDSPGNTTCELSYISGGMTWEADYNAIAPVNGDALDLIGWVTLSNHSGETFENARIKLMAGDVNKVQQQGVGGGIGGGVIRAAVNGPTGQPAVTEQAFDEYHLTHSSAPRRSETARRSRLNFCTRAGCRVNACMSMLGLPGIRNPDNNSSRNTFSSNARSVPPRNRRYG
jgi:hypothetical protein